MDTEKRFGLKKWKAIVLFVQLFLIILATTSTAYVLGFSMAKKVGALFIIVYSVILISYVSIIFYAVYGYKEDDSYFLGAIYTFCLAILLNILLPFRTIYQLVTLTILFGLYIAFAQRLKNIKVSQWLLFFMFLFALAFSVYSTIVAKTDNLNGTISSFLSALAMYVSIWTPVIMTATFGLAYSVKIKKIKDDNI